MNTEDRQAFAVSTSLQETDPTGDVVSRMGTPSMLNQGWADLTGVAWTKDDAGKAWVVHATFAESIPAQPPFQTQLTVYADADDAAADDYHGGGTRNGMDAAWNIKYSAQYGWGIDFQWFNPKPQFWATNRKTQAVPSIQGSTISLRIPFAELPATWSPRWRVMMALQSSTDTQIDVVPGAGFPPAKSAAPASASVRPLPSKTWALVAAGVIGLVAAGFGVWTRKRRGKM